MTLPAITTAEIVRIPFEGGEILSVNLEGKPHLAGLARLELGGAA